MTLRPLSNIRKTLSLDEYESGVRRCDRSILSRALTLVESNHFEHQSLAEELITRLMPSTGRSIRVGITGVPGVGKSTFIDSLGMSLVRKDLKVAVLTIDPSSEISGGSILGDKTRMSRLASETKAFIRPSPNAGTLGGVANKTRESMFVLEAAGFEIILIETIGVGQGETMVSEMTDCFLTLLLPGAGDELQGIKRGLLELVDVLAVNKADGDNVSAAMLAAQQYQSALRSISGGDEDRIPNVLACSAQTQTGIEEVWSAIQQHIDSQKNSGAFETNRQYQSLRWMESLVDQQIKRYFASRPNARQLREAIESQVLNSELTPIAGARQICDELGLS